MAAPPLKQLFSKFAFAPDRRTADQVVKWRVMFETRDTHPEALNTPLLGCAKMGFYPRDAQALFDILHVNKDEVKSAIKASSVPSNFHVVSDEFNLLTVWAAHVFLNDTKLPKDIRERTVKSLFFMLLVKFFSSLVRHYLPYGANKGTMEATIDSLSDKYDIKHKETSTWKLMLEARCEELIQPGNIHWQALKTFIPDQKVMYVVSDIQTRIRTKINLIMMVYFDMVKKGRTISDTEMTDENKEGEKIIKELKNSFSAMVASICARAVNTQSFIRTDYVNVVCKLIQNCRPNMVRDMLMRFSTIATIQYQKHQQDIMSKDGKFYVGYHILLQNLIERTYRKCIMDKVNLKSRYAILERTVNIYSSSRTADDTIQKVKDSVEKFVVDAKLSQRYATNASLKLAFIIYIILLTFDCD